MQKTHLSAALKKPNRQYMAQLFPCGQFASIEQQSLPDRTTRHHKWISDQENKNLSPTWVVVVHPIEHDFRRPVPPSGHVACHEVILLTRQTKIDYTQFHIGVYRYVWGFQITVNYVCTMHVLQEREGEEIMKKPQGRFRYLQVYEKRPLIEWRYCADATNSSKFWTCSIAPRNSWGNCSRRDERILLSIKIENRIW